MKNKPFVLYNALAGVPVYTKDGRRVTQITHFHIPASKYTVYGLIEGEDRLTSFNTVGRFSEAKECGKDLVLRYPEIEVKEVTYSRILQEQ